MYDNSISGVILMYYDNIYFHTNSTTGADTFLISKEYHFMPFILFK
jgi:hypothetical protein